MLAEEREEGGGEHVRRYIFRSSFSPENFYRFCVMCEETLDALLKIPLGNWRSLGKFDRA